LFFDYSKLVAVKEAKKKAPDAGTGAETGRRKNNPKRS